MTTPSADDAVTRHARHVRPSAATASAAHRRFMQPHQPTRARMPSSAGYMLTAVGLSVAVFVLIWWVLRTGEDEAAWLPAGVAAGGVMLIAAAGREVVMRRAWARYTRELELEMRRNDAPRGTVKTPSQMPSGVHASAVALRALQQRLAEAEASGAGPEAHLEAYRLCEQYLANADEAMRSATNAADVRAALRAGQERVRALQKGYLLAWARGEATRLTAEAQRRVRLSDKIETAQRALDVIDEALRVYPGEPELRESGIAVRNFIASVKVGHWVEMAERAAFRGLYGRAVARYRDALFYLSRAEMGEEARAEAAGRIQREIEMLRARLATDDTLRKIEDAFNSGGSASPKSRPKRASRPRA